MERTTKVNTKLRWKKTGGGSLRFGGKIIKPNQTFLASVDEIPESFRDTLICLEEKGKLAQAEEEAVMEMPEKVIYEVVKVEDGIGWNVINQASEKPINDAPLRTKKEAEELKKTLEG